MLGRDAMNCARRSRRKVADDSATRRRAATRIQIGARRQTRAADDRTERRGASVESLQPVRDTLEDYFVQQVTAAKARDTGGL